jgi:hypothetical protein
MSLLVHKRTIERAVLGELAPRDDARLRAHLGACARCRAHYDGLARTAEALGSGRAAAARARQRLFAALDGATAPALPQPVREPAGRARRIWLGASLALVPAAALVLLKLSKEPGAGGEVTLRGGGAVTLRGGGAAEAPPPATVVLYARSKTSKLSQPGIRLVGELPGSGEARVSMSDYLVFGLRGLRAPTHVRVSAVDEQAHVHDYVGDMAVAPGPGPLTLGRSIEVSRGHEPGRLRLVVLFSEKKIDDAAVRAAIARLDAPRTDRGPLDDAGTSVVTGLVVLAP